LSKKSIFYLVAVAIFALGFFLRAVEVISGNYVFLFDQGRDYLAVREIILNHKLALIGPSSGLEGIFAGPFWYYLLAIPFVIWGGDPYGGQVLMLFFGLMTLVLMLLLMKKIFNKEIALIAFFFSAISLPVVYQSTVIWNPQPVSFLILLTFYFLFRYFASRRLFFLGLSFFTSALMYNFEVTVSLAFILYSFLFLLLIDREERLKGYLTSLSALILGYSPAILFDLRHQFLQTRALFDFFSGHSGRGQNPLRFSRSIQLDHLRSFWSNLTSTFNLSELSLIVFLLLVAFLSLWLLSQNLLRKEQKRFFLYCFFFPVATFLFYVFFPNPIWSWYLTHLHFVYIIIASVVIYFAIKKLTVLRLIYVLFLLLMISASFKNLKGRYLHDFFDPRGTAGIKSKMEAIDYVYQQRGSCDFNLLVFTPPIYDYPYEYLLHWYALPKYDCLPGEEPKGEVTLLIEPDIYQPWTYQGWLETVIKKGEVVKERKFDSGFIIQERLIK